MKTEGKALIFFFVFFFAYLFTHSTITLVCTIIGSSTLTLIYFLKDDHFTMIGWILATVVGLAVG